MDRNKNVSADFLEVEARLAALADVEAT